MQPGGSSRSALSGGGGNENRQQFLTFGDASWGSIKLGKDLGIFASDAILNDMTLLGVGSGAGTAALQGNTTTLGRIGTGYIYADWKNQIAYTSPNWNGFSFTAGVTQAWNATGTASNYALNGVTTQAGGSEPAFEGKASYTFADAAGTGVGGKVWVSGITQKLKTATTSNRGEAVDIGATVNVAGFGLTGYYFTGSGIGNQYQFASGLDNAFNERDSDGGYIQATYTIPGVGTKIGASWGVSNLDSTGLGGDVNQGDASNEMWTVGVYHPLTKHLNLVAEYSDAKDQVDAKGTGLATEGKSRTVSLGAILFF